MRAIVKEKNSRFGEGGLRTFFAAQHACVQVRIPHQRGWRRVPGQPLRGWFIDTEKGCAFFPIYVISYVCNFIFYLLTLNLHGNEVLFRIPPSFISRTADSIVEALFGVSPLLLPFLLGARVSLSALSCPCPDLRETQPPMRQVEAV